MNTSKFTATSLILGLVLTPAAQAKPRPYKALKVAAKALPPADQVRKANDAARIEPTSESFSNAVQVYPYTPGSLYRIYTSVGKVTDIALQPGEQLTGSGPIAAGDTVRWIIGNTESGVGPSRQVHILIKPTMNQLSTNLVINTDRRTYHIEVQALPVTYMPSVQWRYAEDALTLGASKGDTGRLPTPIASGISPEKLDFRYALSGPKVAWRPARVFDDGRQVFIEFPTTIASTDLPPLFLIGADGKAELVNYRVSNRYMVVDRLFDTAELRLGDKIRQRAIKIRYVGDPRV